MTEYFLRRNQKRISGPFAATAVRELAEQGKLRPDDELSRGIDGPWKPASSLRRLQSIFRDRTTDDSAKLVGAPKQTRKPTSVTECVWSVIGGTVGLAVVAGVVFVIYKVVSDVRPLNGERLRNHMAWDEGWSCCGTIILFLVACLWFCWLAGRTGVIPGEDGHFDSFDDYYDSFDD